MEEHPIPQNVADFEFHLVGDMTLKQFGYLAGGLVMAYIIFVLFGKSAPFIAFPLVGLFALSGIAFAFLPIQERPLDHWVSAFMAAIFKPTQRKYKSTSLKKDDPFFRRRLSIYLASVNGGLAEEMLEPMPAKTEAPMPQPQKPVIAPIPQAPIQQPQIQVQPPKPVAPPQPPPQPKIPPAQVAPQKPLPDSEELKKTVDLAKEAQIIQSKILQTEKQINSIRVQAGAPDADAQKFAQDFQKIMQELQTLNSEATEISQKIAFLSKTPISSINLGSPVKAKSITSVTLTSTPNIINGIVTDSLGNYVESAIVVAHDKQGLPVRALKSNKLGQFIAATPLPNGVYNLVVEKDDLTFDAVEIELSGKVLNPIVISAKKADRASIVNSV